MLSTRSKKTLDVALSERMERMSGTFTLQLFDTHTLPPVNHTGNKARYNQGNRGSFGRSYFTGLPSLNSPSRTSTPPASPRWPNRWPPSCPATGRCLSCCPACRTESWIPDSRSHGHWRQCYPVCRKHWPRRSWVSETRRRPQSSTSIRHPIIQRAFILVYW